MILIGFHIPARGFWEVLDVFRVVLHLALDARAFDNQSRFVLYLAPRTVLSSTAEDPLLGTS